MKEASSLKTIRIRNLKKLRQVIDGGPRSKRVRQTNKQKGGAESI